MVLLLLVLHPVRRNKIQSIKFRSTLGPGRYNNVYGGVYEILELAPRGTTGGHPLGESEAEREGERERRREREVDRREANKANCGRGVDVSGRLVVVSLTTGGRNVSAAGRRVGR